MHDCNHNDCGKNRFSPARVKVWAYGAAITAVPGAAFLHAVYHMVAHAFGLPCP